MKSNFIGDLIVEAIKYRLICCDHASKITKKINEIRLMYQIKARGHISWVEAVQ